MKNIFRISQNPTYIKIFSLYLVWGWIGSVKNALIFEPYKIGRRGETKTQCFRFTVRTGIRGHYSADTTVYFSFTDWEMWWSSEHIAIWFGEVDQHDHGPVYTYDGFLGLHQSV